MKLPLSYVWIPALIPSKHLVVVLHGQRGSSEDFRPLQNDLGITEFNYLLLDAPDPYATGFRWFNWAGNPLADVGRSRNLLSEVFTAIAQVGYPPERTFLFGFSQGGLMTLEFGARHTRRLAGYVGISGFILDPTALLRDLNPQVNAGDWLVTHGTADEALPVEKPARRFRCSARAVSRSTTANIQKATTSIGLRTPGNSGMDDGARWRVKK